MGQQARTRRERRDTMRREAKLHQTQHGPSVPLLPLLGGATVLVIAGLLFSAAFLRSNGSATATGKTGDQHIGKMDRTDNTGVTIGTPMSFVTGAFPSTSGHKVSLAQYHGKKLVVYFYEGATCGACQQQMIELQKDLPTIRKAGGDVIAVTVDPVDQSQSVADQLKLGFPIVQDTNHRIGSAFHDFHLVTTAMDMGPVDNHAMFVVDKKGVVVWKQLATDTMWVEPSKVVAAVKEA
jgi:peroxiredoxin